MVSVWQNRWEQAYWDWKQKEEPDCWQSNSEQIQILIEIDGRDASKAWSLCETSCGL